MASKVISSMSHECLTVDFVVFYFQNLFGSNSLDGGSSPMIKPKGDKQVEYLDLDLDSGKSTPPRKVSETSFFKYTELPFET